MKPVQLIAGAVAGIVGAAIWAAVAYFANLEIGYIAWGIGGLVGIAVAATGENTALAGVVAVLITAASLVVGKFAVVEISVNDMQAEIDNVAAQWVDQEAEVSDEDLIAYVSNKIATQREEAGEEVKWPEVSDDIESAEATYPADIWKEASEQLAEKSDEEKNALREQYSAELRQAFDALGDAIAENAVKEGFLASFGPMDFLFFGLAIFTAWGIASRDEEA